jgi:acetylornithine deacetylase/succinyl-diaminopimelate desuccinylase-like protein
MPSRSAPVSEIIDMVCHPDRSAAKWRDPDVIQAIESARGKVILLPTSGGTVPLDAMERAANTRTISVPIANHDDNQHAANENLRLHNLCDGIETMAALIAMP